ncbi:MAG TPA: hypothetical protein VNU72_12870 [Puia sp.]|nr:hypothetical protein [Puia sp.]
MRKNGSLIFGKAFTGQTKAWLVIGCISLTVLASCSDDKQDVTQEVNKSGSIETAVSVQHVDSAHDVVVTSHKVWVRDAVFKSILHYDTVPSLGIENTEAENADGDKKNIQVPKDYEIFITVK